MTTPDRVLIERWQRYGDADARNALVERYRGLVRALAARYADRGEPFDERGERGLDVPVEETGFARSDARIMLGAGLQRLDERERRILHLRFDEGLTQSQIAAQLGISQMHVSRLLRRSLETLRQAVGDI